MLFNIYPLNLIRALSLALELSSGGISRHHWRTAMIADRIAETINMPDSDRQTLVYASLLHDIGAAAKWSEMRKLANLKLDEDFNLHAEAGYNLLKDSPQLQLLAQPIRHHHDCWDGSFNSKAAGPEIPLLSRIINLADRVEIQIRDESYIFEQSPTIVATIQEFSGRYFDPELVNAFADVAKRESFWLDMINPVCQQNYLNQASGYGRLRFSIDDVLNIADIFATIIDSTSRFTATHSRTVAEISALLAMIKGYSKQEIKAMRIAGLLHDLGKLSVPNEILEKPGKLTNVEVAIIKQHTYYTYRILEQIDGMNTIAEWAAYHHETLDGRGYPFHISGDRLRLGSRIVAVADVFAALTEKRPYRKDLSKQQVETIIKNMAINNKLDKGIVGELFANVDQAYAIVEHINSN